MPRMLVKPAWATSRSGDSVDPLMTAMQSPRRIASAPSPTLCVPVAQADTMAMLWPMAPVSIAIIPDGLSTSAFAMNVGATVRGPRFSSEVKLSIIICCPPAPEPKMTPTSVRFSSVSSKPESASACFAAATPKCMLDSRRRVEARDWAEPGHAVDEVRPDGLLVVPDGADHAEAGDGHSAVVIGLAQQ